MKKLLLVALLALGCSKKPEVICPECARCPDPVLCKSDKEMLESYLKDWVVIDNHAFKCMKKTVEME